MNFKNKILNNLISKDFELSKKAAQEFVDKCDVQAFFEMCENSDFIFDFIKDKINKNLTNAVNRENFRNIFEFAKIYSFDFEDFILNSMLKYADEDLTDEILENFDKYTKEQQAYFAKYFCYIKDSLAIEVLKKYAKTAYEPLFNNVASALYNLGDKASLDEAISVLKGDFEDREKILAVNFIASYGDKSALDVLFSYLDETFYEMEVAGAILNLITLDEMDFDYALKIYSILLNSYPEFLSLDTILCYEIYNFIKKLLNMAQNSRISYLLFKTKQKFKLFASDDVYTFDLLKETKEEIKKINNILLNKDLKNDFEDELFSDNLKNVEDTLDTIIEENLAYYTNSIQMLLDKTHNEIIICKCLKALHSFNVKINPDIQNKIQNENIKAIVACYLH